MGFFDWIFRRRKDDMHLGWNGSYSLGILEIDIQHKNLFTLYNELVQTIYAGGDKEKLRRNLDSLLNYVVMHFATEEGYMEKYSYPGYEAHASEHRKLREKTYTIHKDFTDGKPVLTMEVVLFLKNWISDHVLSTDRQYKNFFLQRLPKEYRA
ncbi:MAG TPA: bacteriohemerythrin [Dissulfurispiraceae bacterium]|nr:bacteriohemerythrin [Dissulfurispiraceae bacterium]